MRPNVEQQFDFLVQTYFGVRGSELNRFISRAYRDWNRTFRGIGRVQGITEEVLDGAKSHVSSCFEELSRTAVPKKQRKREAKFDSWRRESCERIKDYYTEMLKGHTDIRVTFGQAQKWLNMTMKYCWVCGRECSDQLFFWCPVAHIPIDEVVLFAAIEEKIIAARPCKTWSSWDNYEEYLDFQNRVRIVAADDSKAPLELEFCWWRKYRGVALRNDQK